MNVLQEQALLLDYLKVIELFGDKEDDGLMRIRSRDIALELLEETNT